MCVCVCARVCAPGENVRVCDLHIRADTRVRLIVNAGMRMHVRAGTCVRVRVFIT